MGPSWSERVLPRTCHGALEVSPSPGREDEEGSDLRVTLMAPGTEGHK
jgi:hypothetical protein